MYPRTWVDCDMISSNGSEADMDTESGISMSSSRASSFCGSLDDIIIVTSRDGRTQGKAKFGIATYNILTDLCIREGEYLYCPSEVRYMSSRHLAILAEIKVMAPDVVCFQVLTDLGNNNIFSYKVILGNSVQNILTPIFFY